VRAKVYGFELDLGSLRAGQLLECRRSNDDGAVAVPAGPMQQRGGGLNEALPRTGLVFPNNRTPDRFQRFVREPELTPIEEIAGVLQVAAAILGRHRLSVIGHQSDNRRPTTDDIAPSFRRFNARWPAAARRGRG